MVEVSNLGSQIRDARKQSGETVSKLASAIGVSRGYWYDIEKERVFVKWELILM